MSSRRKLRFLTAFASCVWLAVTAPAAAQQGAIAGRVFDPTSEALANAEVRVDGTTLVAVTDLGGSYRLAPVPAGTQTLTISYLGYETATAEVEVQAGETVRQDVNMAYGEVLVVEDSPFLTGQAKALNRQKNAINITNIVAADQIGRFPDSNAAEATQRIPAITLQRDQGEGRYVQIRGTESRLNSMAINGERIPSPQGDRRDVALDVVPADLLEAIEVFKAITPDMDGDAIGGTVNLVTKRAPENNRFGATIAGGYNDIVEDNIRSANFNWGGRFGDGDTGLVISGSALETDRGSDNFEVAYDDGFLDELELRDYTVERKRFGLTAALDHQIGDSSSFFLRGLWNQFDDQEFRRRKVSVVADGEIERELKDRFETQDILSFNLGGSVLPNESLLVEYRISWSASGEDEPGRLDSLFLQEDVEFAPHVGPGSIDPDNIRANPLNEALSQFEFDETVLEDHVTDEKDLVGAVDLTFPFYRDADFSGYWKAGAKIRFKDKERNNEVFELDIPDLVITDILDDWTSETPFFEGRYQTGRYQDPFAIRNLLRGAERERDIEEDLADYDAEEDTVAVYGMAEIQRGNLSLLGGLRYESTETTYSAFTLNADDEVLIPVADDDSYEELLPMFHLRYRIDEDSNLRAAFTRTLSRANFEDLAPFVFQEDDERERGNPDLDVTTAWNADLLYERYLTPAGVFSAGVFYKTLEENIFTATFDETFGGEEFETTQPRNGSGADLWGAELAYQNRFHELPPPFDGLGVYFNVTFTDSEADFPDRPSTRLQGQADLLGNLAVSYEKGGFSGRLSLNYHDDYILEIGDDPSEDMFVDEHTQLDFSASQRINDRFRLYLELINLTDEPFRVFEGTPDRPIQEEIYSWWGTIGLKFLF